MPNNDVNAIRKKMRVIFGLYWFVAICFALVAVYIYGRHHAAVPSNRDVVVEDMIPCDHGDNCVLRILAKDGRPGAIHSPESYCPLHKMYHHERRSCQDQMKHDELMRLVRDNIRQREHEIGYVAPPTVSHNAPDPVPTAKK